METIPPRHFRDRVSKQCEISVGMKRLGTGMVERILQVVLEILQCKP